MPHINLLYPFIMDDPTGEAFSVASNTLMPVLAEMAPFWIRFDVNSFRFFKHGKNCTLWLKPQSDTMLQSGKICVFNAAVVFCLSLQLNVISVFWLPLLLILFVGCDA